VCYRMHNLDKIDCNTINKLIDNINVVAQDGEDVTVHNPTSLNLIGKGRHGAVFTINEEVCIKIYGEEDVCARELYALSLGQNTNLVPKVYCHDSKYIVMEIVNGIDLREYLQSQPLTKAISAKLIELLVTFKEIGYERIDHHKRHIFVQENGNLKVLDVGTTVWRNRVYPYPRKLLNSLGSEYKLTFLEHVKELNPDLFQEWDQYMEIEKMAASLHKAHFNDQKINLSKWKKKSSPLLTKNTEWNMKIEDLVRKIHKEEWVKALAAKGLNPQQIKDMVGNIEDELNLKQEKTPKKKIFTGNGQGTFKKKDKNKKDKNKQDKKEYKKIMITGSNKKKK